jgi:hypothetical protein
MEPVIAKSARKHGHGDDEILHALRNYVDAFGMDEGFTMIVGPTNSGKLLEVGIIRSEDGALLVIHAMNARDKFLR